MQLQQLKMKIINLLFEDSEIRQWWKHYFETLLDVPENIENLKMPMHI